MKGKNGKVTRNKPREYHRGYRNEILKLTMTGGVISYRSLDLLNGNKRMYIRRMREMCNDGILMQYRLGRNCAVRLKNFERTSAKYIGVMPNGYYGYYKMYCEDDAKFISEYKNKEKKKRAIRTCRQGEVVAMMCASGIEIRPDVKPNLALGEKIADDKGYYFCSREIKLGSDYHVTELKKKGKEWERDSKVLLNSRMFGGIVSPGGTYIVYHSGDAVMRIDKQGEVVMMTHMAKFVNRHCHAPAPTEEGRIRRSIVLGYEPEVFERIVSDEEKKKSEMSVTGYSEMYAIPYSEDGAALLGEMCKENWKEKFVQTVFGKKVERTIKENIYDVKDGSIKKLLFCIPDLCKLRKFITTAEWSERPEEYQIYCFDFQIPFVKMVAKGKTQIYKVNFCDFLHILRAEEETQDEAVCNYST